MRKYFNVLLALSVAALSIIPGLSHAQVTVTDNHTAQQLAAMLLGGGVTVSNETLNCAIDGSGKFWTVSSNLGLDSGIVLTSGFASTESTTHIGVNGQEGTEFPSTSTGNGGDNDLNVLSGVNTFDKCILEFDFVPQGDSIKFDYVFGSVEYTGYSCSNFNDVFGFFISGQQYTNPTNIALIPGTTIPVAINSTTDTAVNFPNDITQCTSMGPGSPFDQYYVTNVGGNTITYNGFTTVLTALADVIPCQTYHLKLAIADGFDEILDSGVFLKAGSLKSNTVSVESVGGGGLLAPEPYCVRGCLPGEFIFHLGEASNFPYVIKYDIGGTAVMGYDYTPIIDSVIIPAGDTTASVFIYGLVVPPVGPKTVELYIESEFNCNGSFYVDTATLTIYDSLYARILTPDTAICRFESVQIQSTADTILSILWTPNTTLSNDTILNPIATPTGTTTYTMVASLPGSGCAPVHDQITITIADEPVVDVGQDFAICLGSSYQFNPTVTPSNQTYSFSWSPATDMDNPNIPNPTITPQADITYYVMVTPTAALCPGYDTVVVDVIPNDFTLENPDTAICEGASIQVRANGPVEFQYQWTPNTGVSNPTIIDPVITPEAAETYVITATHPNCPDIVKSFAVDLQPNPQVFLGPDQEICQWDSLHFIAEVVPDWYTQYSYNWSPDFLDSLYPHYVIFREESDTQVILDVTTPAGCKGSDTVNIIVHPGNFATAAPLNGDLCPGQTLQLTASGGTSYLWTANSGVGNISDPTSANPVVAPESDVVYTLIATDQFGCTDTFEVDVAVHSNAIMSMPDSVTLWPGETYQIDPGGNTLYHSWFPPEGLSAANIANPLASPTVDTRYYVDATTEWGCTIKDSIDIFVNTESVVDMPNAFTPGSAPNAELKIVKKGIATLKSFRIFNRWGQVVFETSDINQGWDGRFNGEPQPMGVYVYTIEALTSTNERVVKQGNVTLIR
jgi:gliding motility-associated-like protein